jgi:hypothetical protein
MKRKTLYLTGAVLAVPALAAGVLVARALSAAPRNQPGPLDRSKEVIERPTKLLVGGSAAAPFVNPKVQPGKVRWHKDFAAAIKAAEKSGKPVLLFQMMGRLDERFC